MRSLRQNKNKNRPRRFAYITELADSVLYAQNAGAFSAAVTHGASRGGGVVEARGGGCSRWQAVGAGGGLGLAAAVAVVVWAVGLSVAPVLVLVVWWWWW